MVGICFYFEEYGKDVWSGTRENLYVWHYAIKAAGDVDRVAMINLTPQSWSFDKAVEFKMYPSLAEWEVEHQDERLTYVGAPNEFVEPPTPLWEFDHQTDWYVFGPCHGHNPLKSGITIPMPTGNAFHAVHAANTVLTHRYHVIGGK